MRNFKQEFFDFADKNNYLSEQIGFKQDNGDIWYPIIKNISPTLAIRLSLILKCNLNQYQIYLENFVKDEETEKYALHINSLEFRNTCKISLESMLEKWNHQLTIT